MLVYRRLLDGRHPPTSDLSMLDQVSPILYEQHLERVRTLEILEEPYGALLWRMNGDWMRRKIRRLLHGVSGR
jgi:hypothetical protein